MSTLTVQQAMQLALQHHQAGRLAEAETLYRQILAVQPRSAEALKNLGNVLSSSDRRAEAIAAYREAAHLNPQSAETWNNLGNLLHKEKRLPEALEALEQARRAAPNAAQIHHNLALILVDLGQYENAEAAYRQALRINPAYPEALYGLGSSLRKQGRGSEAAAAFRQAIEIQPNFAKAQNNLGITLQEMGRMDEALAAFRAAVEIQPNYARAWNNLGNALREMGRADEAMTTLRRALDLQPDLAEACSNLASAFKDLGDLDAAMEAHRWARELQPANPGIVSNLIYTLHFYPRADAAALAAEQREWQRTFGHPAQRFDDWSEVDRQPERRLRVGYVGAEFYGHVVAWNLLPLFKAHDRTQFEIFCYANVVKADAVTEDFRRLSDHWRVTTKWTDFQMAEMIRRDGIDVLVDLSQHMAGNRLLLFTHHPAPVQVSFAGYPESTGVEAIAWRISDRYLEENAAVQSASGERLVLIDSFWCYAPGAMKLLVNETPAKSNGFVTFGSLNNFCKVNPDVIQLWAQVLVATEGSRLILLSHAGSHRERTVKAFEQEGVAANRIEFVEPRARQAYLALYHGIDIVLDPFPYNGHTTSLDALWMGVPVVSLVGSRAVSRAGLSQLTNLGLPELVARTEEEYVAIATKLAGNLARLAELRATLRPRMEASVLMDASHFTRQIETAYRTMWREWCAENPAP